MAKKRGSVTIFSVMCMFLVMVLLTSLEETVRIRATYATVQMNMALASDLLMGNYCRELFDEYGLLFLDGGYGEDSLYPSKIQAEYMEYLRYFQKSQRGFTLLNAVVENGEIEKLKTAVDEGGSYFEDSVCEFEKYALIGDLFDRSEEEEKELQNALEQIQSLREEIDAMKENLLAPSSSLMLPGDLDVNNVSLRNKNRKREVPADPDIFGDTSISDLIDKYDVSDYDTDWDLLNLIPFLIYPNYWDISHKNINKEHAPSRLLDTSSTQPALFDNGKDTILPDIYELSGYDFSSDTICRRLLMIAYADDQFDCYTDWESQGMHSDGQVPKLQLEYLFAGGDDDLENFYTVLKCIFLIRVPCNVAVIQDSEVKMNDIKLAAELVADLSGFPEADDLLEKIFVILWAVLESLCDVTLLTRGEEFSLIKDENEWITDFKGMIRYMTAPSVPSFLRLSFLEDIFPEKEIEITDSEETNSLTGKKMGYRDYLNLFFLAGERERFTFYMMDLIQFDLEGRYPDFRMENMVCGYEMNVSVTTPNLLFHNADWFGKISLNSREAKLKDFAIY